MMRLKYEGDGVEIVLAAETVVVVRGDVVEVEEEEAAVLLDLPGWAKASKASNKRAAEVSVESDPEGDDA